MVFLRGILAGYRIPGRQFSFFQNFKDVAPLPSYLHYFDGKSAFKVILFLGMHHLFLPPSAPFKIFLFTLVLSSLIMTYPEVIFSVSLVLGLCQNSWIWGVTFSSNLGSLQLVNFQIFFLSPSSPTPSLSQPVLFMYIFFIPSVFHLRYFFFFAISSYCSIFKFTNLTCC